MVLTGAQMDAARHRIRQWESTVPPCGISTADICNPCLPERDERGLWCATCGLRQRLEIEARQVRNITDERG